MINDAWARGGERRAIEGGETIALEYLSALQTAKRFRHLAQRSRDPQLSRGLAELAADYDIEAARRRRALKRAAMKPPG